MNDDKERTARAYRRAAIGLAIAAVLWSAAFVYNGSREDSRVNWMIPIGAAALSILCFSLYAKSKG